MPAWLNNWIDARLAAAVKAAVDQANADFSADISLISTRLDALPAAISANVSSIITLASADLGKAIDEVPQTVNTVLTNGVLSVQQLEQVVTQAVKSISGGLFASEGEAARYIFGQPKPENEE